MKKYIFSLVCLLIFGTQAQSQNLSRAAIRVSGLTCSMCSRSTEMSLRKLDFIDSIRPDLENTTFYVTFKKNAVVNLDKIASQVEKAGFFVSSLKLWMQVEPLTINKDSHIEIDGNWYHFMNVDAKTQIKGEIPVQLVDKHFIDKKDFKLWKTKTQFACYSTGYMQACCDKGKANRIFHLVLQ